MSAAPFRDRSRSSSLEHFSLPNSEEEIDRDMGGEARGPSRSAGFRGETSSPSVYSVFGEASADRLPHVGPGVPGPPNVFRRPTSDFPECPSCLFRLQSAEVMHESRDQVREERDQAAAAQCTAEERERQPVMADLGPVVEAAEELCEAVELLSVRCHTLLLSATAERDRRRRRERRQ